MRVASLNGSQRLRHGRVPDAAVNRDVVARSLGEHIVNRVDARMGSQIKVCGRFSLEKIQPSLLPHS